MDQGEHKFDVRVRGHGAVIEDGKEGVGCDEPPYYGKEASV